MPTTRKQLIPPCRFTLLSFFLSASFLQLQLQFRFTFSPSPFISFSSSNFPSYIPVFRLCRSYSSPPFSPLPENQYGVALVYDVVAATACCSPLLSLLRRVPFNPPVSLVSSVSSLILRSIDLLGAFFLSLNVF